MVVETAAMEDDVEDDDDDDDDDDAEEEEGDLELRASTGFSTSDKMDIQNSNVKK